MADDWTETYQHLVLATLRQRDWQLIPANEISAFVAQVRQAIADGLVSPQPGASAETTIRRATIHVYCRHLYTACNELNTDRQRRAFEELGRHAQGVAFRYEHNPAIIQPCVQQALETVWQKLSQVKQPGSLLRWVETIVYHEIKAHWNTEQQRLETPVSDLIDSKENDNVQELERFWEILSSVPPPDDEVISRELREQLWQEVKHSLAGSPRQAAVIIGYFLYEISLPALAEMLHLPVENVYVLKSRALASLRKNQEFLGRFADALETVPEKRGKR